MNCDYLIIGAGIVGLSVAYKLQQRNAGKIIVIDKENQIAAHQSSHNSGVIHAGVYYKPGSMKSRFCKLGVKELSEFCLSEGIPFQRTGKLIVATDEKEYLRMNDLYHRALGNEIEIELLDEHQARELEPHIKSVGALLSPTTSIVDYAQVCQKLAQNLKKNKLEILLNQHIVKVYEKQSHVEVHTSLNKIHAEKVIVCAGLHSDKVAKLFGAKVDFKVVPFRGEFFEIKHVPDNLIKHLIYPVPDPERPFLGVHLTRKVSGKFTVGPNAVLAASREGYKYTDINLADMYDSLSYAGFWKMLRKNFLPAMNELKSSLSKQNYLKKVQKYCPQIELKNLYSYPAGVRAQAVSKDGEIIDDFKFIQTARTLHVCNAPSPAATSSLPIAQHIVDMINK